MKDFEAFKKQILAELDKIKDNSDEKVKDVFSKVTEMFDSSKFDNKELAAEPTVTEESTPAEPKKEDKPEAEAKEEVKADAKEEVKEEAKEPVVEDKKEDDDKVAAELSAVVSEKLKQASLELSTKEESLSVDNELIAVKDAKIVELQAELKVFTDKVELELKVTKDQKVSHLIELYAGLGLSKNRETIELAFNEEQIDKLTIDLAAMQPSNKSVAKPKRQTSVTSTIELNANKVEKITDQSQVDTLFANF